LSRNRKSESAAKIGAEREHKESSSKSKMSAFKIILFIILILIGLGAIFAALKSSLPDLLGGSSLSGKLAATVNGQEITLADLDASYNKLPAQYKYLITKEAYLEQMIDQTLLKQEAVKEGMSVSDAEAEANIQLYLNQNNITKEELNEILKNQSIEYKEIVQASKDQLAVQKLLEFDVTSKVNITEQEALTYYNQNKDSFASPETFTVRHILISVLVQNRTRDEAKKDASNVLSKVEASRSSICQLVIQFSDDKGSIQNCGEYEFSKGQLPDEFWNWSVKAKPGDLGIVETIYGEHIVMLLNHTPEKQPAYSDVEGQILDSLKKQMSQILYQQFTAQLRKQSVIKNYLSAQNTNTTNNIVVGGETQEIQLNGSNTVVLANDTESQQNTTVAPEATTQAQPEISNPGAASESKIDCLANKAPVLYGASWNADTARQKNALGDSISRIKYVECSISGDYRSQTSECKNAGVEAYPTWKIAGNAYPGVYSLDELANLAGCV
jgi:foldase protein PrsA